MDLINHITVEYELTHLKKSRHNNSKTSQFNPLSFVGDPPDAEMEVLLYRNKPQGEIMEKEHTKYRFCWLEEQICNKLREESKYSPVTR